MTYAGEDPMGFRATKI
ncbi:hypothetical protein [Nostoc sp. LEGE 06077]